MKKSLLIILILITPHILFAGPEDMLRMREKRQVDSTFLKDPYAKSATNEASKTIHSMSEAATKSLQELHTEGNKAAEGTINRQNRLTDHFQRHIDNVSSQKDRIVTSHRKQGGDITRKILDNNHFASLESMQYEEKLRETSKEAGRLFDEDNKSNLGVLLSSLKPFASGLFGK